MHFLPYALLVPLLQPGFAVANIPKSPFTPPGSPPLSSILQYIRTHPTAGACCAGLSYVLGADKVAYPVSVAYTGTLATYWTQQESAVTPACIVEPIDTSDVSKAVYVLSVLGKQCGFKNECKFAIKGGGHTPFAGAANQQGGVTIDLAKFKEVTVNADQTMTRIGPGNRWVDVYRVLDAKNLATSGGRVATVGVPGLTTGGGISFFSARKGFVCDNVVNFEVVLPYGKIVNVNESTPDLYRALKGGSNNFGVVTRFDMRTFPSGRFFGGDLFHPIDVKSVVLDAFYNFTNQKPYDEYAALINSFGFTAGNWIVGNQLEYTKVPAQPYPPVFKPFTDIQPQIINTLRTDNLTSFTLALASTSPQGRRALFVTFTFASDRAVQEQTFNIANSTLQPIKLTAGLVYSVSFQPIVTAITSKSGPGGNSLGLGPEDGNLVNVLLTVQWQLPTDDAAVEAAAASFISQASQNAKNAGKFNEYLYLNYAAKYQKPIASYNATNVAKLMATSKKYDPDQIFQLGVPGGFKLTQ